MPGLTLPLDSRTAASCLALDRALGWYLGEVPSAKEPPVSAEDARALKAALAGQRDWRPELFERLVTFAQAMYRLTPLDPAVPRCNLGDALTALSRVPTDPDAEPWRFEPGVDPATFAKLEFRETSLGIARAQREHREGWWAHAQKNRAFIEAAAAGCARFRLAVVLGAGQPFDLPLAALARRFERLVLVDIDAEALTDTAAALAKEVGAGAARIETRVLDLTGVNRRLVARIEQILGEVPGAGAPAAEPAPPPPAERALDQLLRLCRSYRLAGPPELLPPSESGAEGQAETQAETRADLLVSSCVVSQLAWPQRVYAERLFEARFGPLPAAVEHRWSAGWTELGLRLQQDHLNALGEAADRVALTSDVVSHLTVWDPRAAAERPKGRKVFPLGVESLLERIPCLYRASDHTTWKWSRYRASRKGGDGSIMDVEGLVLSEARSAGGLWLGR